MVDRNPEPEIVEDDAGLKYDVSKPYPELITDTRSDEEKQESARLRQSSGVLNAKDIVPFEESDKKYITIEFLEPGLTAEGHVWKKGETLRIEDSEEARRPSMDTEENVWYDLSAEEQKKRYGKVMFEKR